MVLEQHGKEETFSKNIWGEGEMAGKIQDVTKYNIHVKAGTPIGIASGTKSSSERDFYGKHLDFRIDDPLAGLVGTEVAEHKLSTPLLIVFAVILGNHPGAVRGFVVGIVIVCRRNKPHVKSHLSGVVRGDKHLRLLLSFRKRSTSQYGGISTL